MASDRNDVSYKDGRVYFTSSTSFETYVARYNQGEYSEEFLRDKFDFVSVKAITEDLLLKGKMGNEVDLDSKYLRLINRNSETYVEPRIDSDVIASILNSDFEFQIADEIVKIANEKTFLVPVTDFSSDNFADVATRSFDIIQGPVKNLARGEISTCTNQYEKRKKMKGSIVQNILGIYNEWKVKNNHYKKRLGIWWADNTNSLRTNGWVSAEVDGEPETPGFQPVVQTQNFDKTTTNDNKVKVVLNWNIGVALAVFPFTFVDADVNFSGVLDDGKSHSCSATL